MLLLTKYSIVNFAAFPWVYKKKKLNYDCSAIIHDGKVSARLQNILDCFKINYQYLNTKMLYTIPTELHNDTKPR